MRKTALGFLFVIFTLAFCEAGCAPDVGWAPGTTAAALTTSSCAAFHAPRTVDVTLSDGSCVRYLMPTSPAFATYAVNPAPLTVVHVNTGSQAAAWVCDTATPAGAPGAPCWSGGINNGFRRVRGTYSGGAYGPASRDVTGIVGRSFVLSLGLLLSPGPPACPYQLTTTTADDPTHWHACGTSSDSGLPDFTANNDPADNSTCCQVSAQWPSGLSGSPCTANDAPGVGYSTVNYPPAGVGSCPAY